MKLKRKPANQWLGKLYQALDGTIKRTPLVRSETKVRMSKKDRLRLRKETREENSQDIATAISEKVEKEIKNG